MIWRRGDTPCHGQTKDAASPQGLSGAGQGEMATMAAVLVAIATLGSWTGAAAASTTVIHTFTGAEGNGGTAALIQASDGFFYGVSAFGGAADPDGNADAGGGTVFRMDAAGQVTVFHSFDRCDPAGYEPRGALIQGSDGALYGTTFRGGEGNSCTTTLDDRRGTVFRMTLDGTMSTVHTFVDHHDGDGPWAGLVEGPDGALYGTTRVGGDIQQACRQAGARSSAAGGSSDRGIAYRYSPLARPVLKDVGARSYELWAGDPGSGETTGTVILDGRARDAGVVVTLTSSRPRVLQVPPSVKVKNGWSMANFPITTSPSNEARTVIVTATYGGISRTMTITVHAST